jgi:predicted glycosyltransferase
MGRSPGDRLLIYSQDGLGLGHQRRTTLLARQFLAARPQASVLTICDSPLGHFFATAPGHEHLKLPSVVKIGPGDWRPVSLAMPFADVLALRKEIIRSTVEAFSPDVLLVDHMPHGAMGELVPALEAVARMGIRTVLGLRDILDAPATVRQRWHLEGAFDAVARFYDDVLVYGSAEVFDVAAQYDWPPSLTSRLRYCGYICAPSPRAASRNVLRRRLLRNHGDAALVVAMAGGGADGYPLFETVLRALPHVIAQQPCVLVLVTGPFLPPPQRAQVKELARGLPVVLRATVPDSVAYLGAADLVVAMAGYNTTAEILSLGTRALLVPRSGPSAEQRLRAEAFADRGWVDWLQPEQLEEHRLAEAISGALATPAARDGGPAPDLRGTERAVEHILGRPADSPCAADELVPAAARLASEA